MSSNRGEHADLRHASLRIGLLSARRQSVAILAIGCGKRAQLAIAIVSNFLHFTRSMSKSVPACSR